MDTSLSFASVIDHTFLKKTEEPQKHIQCLVEQAHTLTAFAVCVDSMWADFTRQQLLNLESKCRLAVTVGFPDGDLYSYQEKIDEMKRVAPWVDEYDVVMPVKAFLAGRVSQVSEHLLRVCEASQEKCIKVIIETGLLKTDELKQKACELVCEVFEQVGTSYAMLKTSTGFLSDIGASTEDMRIMSAFISDHVGVKASGGVSSLEHAGELFKATGLSTLDPRYFRIGSSSLLLSLGDRSQPV